MIFKLFKFIIVGFFGLFIDFGLTVICKEKLSLNKYLSNSIGFLLAVSSNYFLNRVWTFGSKNPEIMRKIIPRVIPKFRKSFLPVFIFFISSNIINPNQIQTSNLNYYLMFFAPSFLTNNYLKLNNPFLSSYSKDMHPQEYKQ